MKKLSIAIFTLVIMLSAIGCAPTSGNDTSSKETPSSKEAETAKPNKENSKYKITIDESKIAKDYEGKDVIIVDFTFTNLTDEATCYMTAFHTTAYQGGVELTTAILTGNDDFDSQAFMKKVKKDTPIKVQMAYKLTDKSEVEIEVKEFISLNNEIIAKKTFTVA